MTSSDSPSSREGILDSIEEQTEDLCHIHDHITRVSANFDIDERWFAGYDDPGRAKYDLEPMVKTYMYTREFDQSELARRLKGAAYVYIRLGLENQSVSNSSATTSGTASIRPTGHSCKTQQTGSKMCALSTTS